MIKENLPLSSLRHALTALFHTYFEDASPLPASHIPSTALSRLSSCLNVRNRLNRTMGGRGARGKRRDDEQA